MRVHDTIRIAYMSMEVQIKNYFPPKTSQLWTWHTSSTNMGTLIEYNGVQVKLDNGKKRMARARISKS